MIEGDVSSESRLAPLVILTNVKGARDGDELLLDRKALEGLEFRAEHWAGPVAWMLSFGDTPPGYFERYDPAKLPFSVIEVAPDRADVVDKLPAGAILAASADGYLDFKLAELLPGRVVYIIEYTLRTRLDILRVTKASLPSKLYKLIWELATERRRKRAMRASAGMQCNGLPAYRRYGALSPLPMVYFDTRLTRAMQIDADALCAKQVDIRSGGPLRLAFSGRLDRMKGAHFLLPLMRKLRDRGADFIFEIFGSGALYDSLEKAAAGDLAGKLLVRGPVPFAEALVPAMKERIDLFVCPHPQGDPSCTYMETLGCGVPIAGFANEAWAAMAQGQNFGETVPVGDVDALAETIVRLDRDRERLAAMAGAAAEFSSTRTFEDAFAARVAHLRELEQQLRKA